MPTPSTYAATSGPTPIAPILSTYTTSITYTISPREGTDPNTELETSTYELVLSWPDSSARPSPSFYLLDYDLAPGGATTDVIITPVTSRLDEISRLFSPELVSNSIFGISSPVTSTDSDGLASTSTSSSSFTDQSSSSLTTSATLSTSSPTSPSADSANGASASSSTGPATTVQSQRKQGLSTGATAGVAIGCLIAGAIIAGLIALALFARRKKRHRDYAPAANYEPKEHSSMGMDTPIAKGPSVAVASLAPTSAAAIVEEALPRPADNETLRAALAGLRTQISNHVLSFYRTNPSQEQVPLEVLPAVLAGSGSPPENMQALLQDHRTRPGAMRFLLGWATTSRMDPRGTYENTFLPDEVAALRNQLMTNETGDEARGAFLSKWRTITAYLLSPTFERPEDSTREHKVDDAVAAIDAAVKTYAKGDNAERLRNLDEVLRRAERLAFMLFAQPGEVAFDWGRVENGIVVFPAVVRTVDEEGRVLGHEELVLEKDVVRV